MQQIRIARNPEGPAFNGRDFACEWMEDCQMNRWLLKARLADSALACGATSHRLETRPMERSEQPVAA